METRVSTECMRWAEQRSKRARQEAQARPLLVLLPSDVLLHVIAQKLCTCALALLRRCSRRLRALLACSQRGTPLQWYAYALQHGTVPLLEYTYSTLRVPVPRAHAAQLYAHAVQRGSVPLLEWLARHVPSRRSLSHQSVIEAAARGDLALLRWLLENGSPHVPLLFRASNVLARHAARHGHLPVLRWLRANAASRIDSNVLCTALEAHEYATVGWLRTLALDALGERPDVFCTMLH